MNGEEIVARRKEHFGEVLNVDSAETELPGDTGAAAAARDSKIRNLRSRDNGCHDKSKD